MKTHAMKMAVVVLLSMCTVFAGSNEKFSFETYRKTNKTGSVLLGIGLGAKYAAPLFLYTDMTPYIWGAGTAATLTGAIISTRNASKAYQLTSNISKDQYREQEFTNRYLITSLWIKGIGTALGVGIMALEFSLWDVSAGYIAGAVIAGSSIIASDVLLIVQSSHNEKIVKELEKSLTSISISLAPGFTHTGTAGIFLVMHF